MKKMAYFDMDGTIANFYGVDGWLDCLMAHDPRPYAVAEPLFTAEQFAEIVQILQAQGFGIGIISWCSKENNKGFNAEIRKAKRRGLQGFSPMRKKFMWLLTAFPNGRLFALKIALIRFFSMMKNRICLRGKNTVARP